MNKKTLTRRLRTILNELCCLSEEKIDEYIVKDKLEMDFYHKVHDEEANILTKLIMKKVKRKK